jgi:hypothetical protein
MINEYYEKLNSDHSCNLFVVLCWFNPSISILCLKYNDTLMKV